MSHSENTKIENTKIPVLYIAGTGRNGSTLMERILNETPGFFAAGELGWADLFVDDACLCGQKFENCPVWKNILNDTVFKTIDKKAFVTATEKYHKKGIKTLLGLLTRQTKQKPPDDLKQYLNNLQIVYNTIHKHLGCQVITDSTCLPLYGYYLSLVPSIDLYVVHLVRDPRGFAHSWNQKKMSSENVPWSPSIPPFVTAFSWLKRNWFIELVLSRSKGIYLRIHYEDFIKNPIQTIEEIGSLLNLKLEPSHFIKDNTVFLGENHLSAGNVDAIKKQGEIVLKLDERWKRDMKWWNIVLVTLITWPLLLKYFVVDKIMKKRQV